MEALFHGISGSFRCSTVRRGRRSRRPEKSENRPDRCVPKAPRSADSWRKQPRSGGSPRGRRSSCLDGGPGSATIQDVGVMHHTPLHESRSLQTHDLRHVARSRAPNLQPRNLELQKLEPQSFENWGPPERCCQKWLARAGGTGTRALRRNSDAIQRARNPLKTCFEPDRPWWGPADVSAHPVDTWTCVSWLDDTAERDSPNAMQRAANAAWPDTGHRREAP